LLLSEEALVYVCVIAVLYAVAFVTSRLPAELQHAAVAGVAANILTLIWLSLEAQGAVESVRVLTFSISAIMGGVRRRAARDRDRGPPEVSAPSRHRHLRRHPDQDGGGDPLSIGPVHRIVSFAGIGALLLACSLLFHRVKHVVPGGERDGAGGA
jgi:hypothetical protein